MPKTVLINSETLSVTNYHLAQKVHELTGTLSNFITQDGQTVDISKITGNIQVSSSQGMSVRIIATGGKSSLTFTEHDSTNDQSTVADYLDECWDGQYWWTDLGSVPYVAGTGSLFVYYKDYSFSLPKDIRDALKASKGQEIYLVLIMEAEANPGTLITYSQLNVSYNLVKNRAGLFD